MFGAVPVRLGLSHPIFDPHALESMPFRRPVTIVSDTSGGLAGRPQLHISVFASGCPYQGAGRDTYGDC